MPLKHRIETAYIVLLGLAIILTGVVSSLLPTLPDGFFFWCVLLAFTCVYPASLLHTFRLHRADKIFRFLHWFPAFIVVLWFLLAFFGFQFPFLLPLFTLCFSFLGLFPAFLGLAFLAAFCVRVVRRRLIRLGSLLVFSLLLLSFVSFVHAQQIEATLSRMIFPTFAFQRAVSSYFLTVSDVLGISLIDDAHRDGVIAEELPAPSSFLPTYYPPRPDPALLRSLRERENLLRMSNRVHHLPRTGSEHTVSLALFLLAFYTALLHYRAVHRQ